MSFNSWDVSYSSISFVKEVLGGHNKVTNFTRKRDILFIIKLKNGTTLNMLLVDEYCLGLAAVYRARSEFPEADYIVTCANWNGYTKEAKDYGTINDLGIYNIGEFLGAIYSDNPKLFYKKDDEGKPVYAYKVA